MPRARGAGLTYCGGFTLRLGGDHLAPFTVRVTATMLGARLLDPPQLLLEEAIAVENGAAMPRELRVGTSVGDGPIGHVCLERFTIRLIGASGEELLELEIVEKQYEAHSRVVRGVGFTAISGAGADGPITLRYEPWHGFIN